MYAGVGVGAYNDAHDASKRAVKIKAEFKPNPDNFDAYQKSHDNFVNVYDALNQRVF
jgi:xylulokinase